MIRVLTPEQVVTRAERTLQAIIAKEGISPAVLVLCRMYEGWEIEARRHLAVTR